MQKRGRRVAYSLLAAALAIGGVILSGALAARRASGAAALEAEVLSRDIAFLEARLDGDSLNWLLGGHLADLYTFRFRAQADLADLARAEHLARAALPLRIDRSAGYARLSAILLTQHRFAEAYDAALIAIEGDADDGALSAFVDAARAVGDNAGAAAALARMDSRSFAATIRLADRFSNEGRLDAAVRAVNRACDRLVETGAARELRAWCYTRIAALEHTRGGVGEARRWLRRALAVQPQHRGATEMLADLAYAEGNWRAALRLYERIATAAHPDLYLRLAEVNRALGRADFAAAHEHRFLELASAPELETLYALPLAMHYADAGRCNEASALVRSELARRHSAEALERVAWVRYRCKDLSGAATALAQATAAAPPSPSTDYLQGLLRRERGDASAAAALMARAASDPTQLEHYVLKHMRSSSGGAS